MIRESRITMARACSGLMRIRVETEFSVLKRKCGLIWLASASRRAWIRRRFCSSSLTSLRVLFQTLSGIVMQKYVEA